MDSRLLRYRLLLVVLLGIPISGKAQWITCYSDDSSVDYDWDGEADYRIYRSTCSWRDPQTGNYQSQDQSSEGFRPSVSAWMSPDPGVKGLGESFGTIRPGGFVGLQRWVRGSDGEVVGLALRQKGGGVRYGWYRREGDVSTVEFAENLDAPVSLGVPPGPRWSPGVSSSDAVVDPLSASDIASGFLRRFRNGQPYYPGGVVALELGLDARLWGIGRGATLDFLFSVREDGGDFQAAAPLPASRTVRTYELTSAPGGFLYITSPDDPGAVYQFEVSSGVLKNLRGPLLNTPVRSGFRLLSDGMLYGLVADGFVRMRVAGDAVERFPLKLNGVVEFGGDLVESPDGWLYLTARSGGPNVRLVIVRCRNDGSEATRWFDASTPGTLANGIASLSGLVVTRSGNLYGVSEPGQGLMFGFDPKGVPVWSASGSSWSVCQADPFGGGQSCYSLASQGSVRGRLFEGSEGFLYGLSAGAVFRVSTNSGGVAGGLHPEPVSQHSALGGSVGSAGTKVWAQNSEGVLYIPTPTGIFAFRPGCRGVEPVWTPGASGNDGAGPQGTPVRGGSGMIYGVTAWGGVLNQGVVYSAREDGGEGAVLHAFTGGPGDVMGPSPFLVMGGDGWLYGTSTQGERYDFAPRLYRVSPGGDAFEVLAALPGGYSGRQQTPCGLGHGRNGTLIGTTPSGGVANLGVIFRFDPVSRAVSVLHEFGTTESDRWRPWPEVLEPGDGFVYGLVSGQGTNQLDAEGVFRMRADGSECRVVARIDRDGSGLRFNGGLTLARDGHLYAVRTLLAPRSSREVYQAEILRLRRTGNDPQAWNLEAVFRNRIDHEPFLTPSGRLTEMPDGSLVGFGSRWETLMYRVDPGTGSVERLVRAGFGGIEALIGAPAPYAAPVPMGDAVLVATVGGSEWGTLRVLPVRRPPPPVSLGPRVLTNIYSPVLTFSPGSLLFQGENYSLEIHGSPPGSRVDPGYAYFLPVGTHSLEVVARDASWPPQPVTNRLTWVIEPRSLILSPRSRTVPPRVNPLTVTGTVAPSLADYGISVSWVTAAGSESSAGDYPIVPQISDPLHRLGNFQVTTNQGWLRIVEPRARTQFTSAGLLVSLPGVPGVRYVMESATNLVDPDWQRVGSAETRSDSPLVFSLPQISGPSPYFLRVTASW